MTDKRSTYKGRSARLDMSEVLARISAHDLAHTLGGGTVKRAGSGKWLIRCPHPSHPDRRPSCSVQTADGTALWHCFSCKAGGNAITWLRLTEGRSDNFNEELIRLCEIFRIDMDSAIQTEERSYSQPTKKKLSADDFRARAEEELKKMREEPDPPLKSSFAERIQKEQFDGEELLSQFGMSKRIPVDFMKSIGVHSAERPHLCNADCEGWNGEETAEEWMRFPVVRVPQFAHSLHESLPTVARDKAGLLIGGYQDILRKPDARVHFNGNNKRTAVGSPYPAVGMNDITGMDDRVLLLEGVTDWLTGKLAAPGWPAVGALGAERMIATSAVLADLYTQLNVKGALLVVIGDGDAAGDAGAEAAVNIWKACAPQGRAIRLRPTQGSDLSDEWVNADHQGADPAWFETALNATIEAATEHRWDICDLPVFGGAGPAMYDKTLADTQDETDSNEPVDNQPTQSTPSYEQWPNSEACTGRVYFIVQLDPASKGHIVRCAAATLEQLLAMDAQHGSVGILKKRHASKLHQFVQAHYLLGHSENTKLKCEGTIYEDGTLDYTILEACDSVRPSLLGAGR